MRRVLSSFYSNGDTTADRTEWEDVPVKFPPTKFSSLMKTEPMQHFWVLMVKCIHQHKALCSFGAPSGLEFEHNLTRWTNNPHLTSPCQQKSIPGIPHQVKHHQEYNKSRCSSFSPSWYATVKFMNLMLVLYDVAIKCLPHFQHPCIKLLRSTIHENICVSPVAGD